MAITIDISSILESADGIRYSAYRAGDAPIGGTDPTTLPLATWPTNFTYAGAFKMSASITDGTLASSDGAIGLSTTSGNMYVSLHPNTDRGIAEISIPTLSTSSNIADLNEATEVQSRLDLFNTPDGNPDSNDKIAALYPYGSDLLYSLVKFYDGDANNTDFFAKATGIGNFATATLSNQIGVNGNYRAAGWISDVPTDWQSALGYNHIMGNADNWSNVQRSSMGPSAYGFDITDLASLTDPISTQAFQSYSMANGEQLQQQVNPAWDLFNTSGNNDVWTYDSITAYGFIIPGTRTYACFGSSAGHSNGIGYKITQDNSNVCSGYCPATAADWSFYYWLFDLNDWIDVKNGVKQKHEVAPYEYGPFNTPFESLMGTVVGDKGLRMRGGVFDPVAGRLYLTAKNNYKPGSFNEYPLVYAYDITGV